MYEPNRQKKENSENALIEKVIHINRVTKVTKGGKNMSFSALVVVGDGNGNAGYALGKANEVAEAIRKGIKKAKKCLVPVKRKGTSIAHDIYGHFGASSVILKPASQGTGVIASLPIRSICECSGIHDILTKILKKSTNPMNTIKAAFQALETLKG